MSRFTEEYGRVPRTARGLAYLLALGIAVLLFLGPIQSERESQAWPLGLKLLVPALAAAVIFTLVNLIGYVYADSKRRGMRYVMWTLLATFMPQGTGIILYFILRDPLPRPCHGCGTVTPGSFTFCPHCGTALRPRCPQCGKAVERAWVNCAFCGVKLPTSQLKGTAEKAELTT